MKIKVSKTVAEVSDLEQLTSGMVGKTVEAEFSSDWDGLTKVAVFSNGEISKDVINPSATIVIPWEVLATANKTVFAGFYGYTMEDGEKVLAIPTIYVDLGRARKGADPSDDPSTLPSPTVSEQMYAAVESLTQRIDNIACYDGEGSGIHPLVEETELADGDEYPFYDSSAGIIRKSTWQNIKSKLKAYFDTMYLGASSLVAYATRTWVQEQSYGTYSKPADGIPESDLESAVQASLGKAETTLQAHQSLAAYATETWVEDKGYLTEHQSLSAYRTASAQDAIDNSKVDKVSGKGLSTNDYTNSAKTKVDNLGAVAAENVVPVSKGGTGASAALDAFNTLCGCQSVNATTDLVGAYFFPFSISTSFTIDSVAFPQYGKGVYVSVGKTATSVGVIMVVGSDAALYTARRSASGTWTDAKKFT